MADQYGAILKQIIHVSVAMATCVAWGAEYVNQVLSQYEQPFLSYAALSVFHGGKLYKWAWTAWPDDVTLLCHLYSRMS